MATQEYWYVTDIERNFKYETADKWFAVHWTDAFVYSAIYLILIFAGRRAMHHRNRFDLHNLLACWSGLLAIFSMMGFSRILYEYKETVTKHGINKTMCDKSYLAGVPGFWCLLFTLSKVLELFDTAFIVLRKQKLIFLHWYHHVTVLIYCFYSHSLGVPQGRYFVLMNYFVHGLMYSYYALKASRMVKIPGYVNILITSLQLTQMIIGLAVNLYVYFVLEDSEDCPIFYKNLYWSFAMYLSYCLLFAKFFYDTYVISSKKRIKEEAISNGKMPTKTD